MILEHSGQHTRVSLTHTAPRGMMKRAEGRSERGSVAARARELESETRDCEREMRGRESEERKDKAVSADNHNVPASLSV